MNPLLIASLLLSFAEKLIGSAAPEVAPVGPPLPDAPPTAPQPGTPPAPPPTAPQPGTPPAPQSGPVIKDRARLDRAAAAANKVAANIRAAGKNYDRALLKAFQSEAKLKVDGVYGPASAGAVKWYTGQQLPPFVGNGYAPYAPNF